MSAPDKRSIQVGDPAPRFELLDDRGEKVSLTDFRGTKNVVIIFYPGDDTVGCTKQLCAVRDDAKDFTAASTVVFGINPGSRASHVAFKDKYGLTARLLVDSGRKVTEVYGAVGKFFGNPTTRRTVVAVDTLGRVRFYRHGMPSNRSILASFSKVTS